VTTYDERLVAPPLWWAGGLLVSLIVAGSLHGGEAGLRAVLPYLLVPLLTLAALARASRGRVRITGGVLYVPGARIPLTHLGGVTALDVEGTRRVRGPLAEPRAYVVSRPWLSRSVRVQVEDPEDDTPYWLIGTGRPEELAAALRATPS
jgi:hypothetical protein